jgi:hypothetical protein
MIDLTAHCVAQYKLNDCDITTAVANSVAGGTDGTSLRTTALLAASGKIGKALHLDGASDILNTQQTFESVFQGSFAINAWVNCDLAYSGDNTNFILYVNDDDNLVRVCVESGAYVSARYSANYDEGGPYTATAQTPEPIALTDPTGWHMVTVNFIYSSVDDMLHIDIYIDGALSISGTPAEIIAPNFVSHVNPVLGYGQAGGPYCYYDGKLDNVCIFDKELDAEEIAFLYNSGDGTEALTDLMGTSRLSKAMEGAKILLADSTTFQAITGAADAEEAKAFIHLAAYVPDAGAFVRPFALVSSQGADSCKRIGTGAWNDSGTFKILIEREIPAAYQADDQQTGAELEFKNQIGEIIEEIRDLSNQPGYLILRQIRMTDGPFRYAAEELKNVMGCWIEALWGLE